MKYKGESVRTQEQMGDVNRHYDVPHTQSLSKVRLEPHYKFSHLDLSLLILLEFLIDIETEVDTGALDLTDFSCI